jgi:hypothetical protein
MKTPTIYPLLLCTVALSAAATLYACGGGGGGGGDTAAPAPAPAPPATPKAWQGAKAVDTTLSGIGFNSAVAVDASGNAISVWQQFDGTRSNIVASRYSASTGLWADALPLEKSDGPASLPRIAMDAGGNAIAIWQQSDNARDNIYVNRYSASNGWGDATLLETNDTGRAIEPQISMDAAGNAVAVWQQFDGTRYSIWARRYDASAGWGVPQAIETNDDGDATAPQVAVDATGNAVAVWRQLVGTHAGIWASRTNAGAWGKPELIETDNLGFAFEPQVAVDAKGNAMVVWQQFDSVRYHIKSNRFVVGSGWGTTTPVESNTTASAADPQVATDANGNAVAVWLQANDAIPKVWANRYTIGTGWGKPAPLENDDSSTNTEPRVAMDKFGNATVVWTQTTVIRSGVWTRTSNSTSPSVWGAAVPIDEPTGGEAQSPQIAMNTDGVAMAVWRQVKNLRDAVWSNTLR